MNKQSKVMMKLVRNIIERFNCEDLDDGNIKETLKKLQAIADSLPEWISVKDRLPELGDDYLVWVKGCRGSASYITKCLFALGKFQHEGIEKYITHWQPLPQPPKEANE